MIYSFILHKEFPIELDICIRRGAKREIVRRGHHRDRNHRGLVYDARSRQWVEAPPSPLSLLYVSREIYVESAQVLYADNIFSFATITALGDFLDLIKADFIPYLKHIALERRAYKKSTARSALMKLAAAKSLRTLQFHHWDFCAMRNIYAATVRELARNCGPLIRSLHASYQ